MIENNSIPQSEDEVVSLILSSASLYPKDIDSLDRMHFVSMSPETYRASLFLDHRMTVSNEFQARVPLDALTSMFEDYFLKCNVYQ